MVDRIMLDTNVLAALCQQYSIKEMALFGSVLRSDFRLDSDIDVLVEFDADAETGLFQLVELQESLSSLFGRPVDLVTKSMLSPYFREEVLTSREVIYVRS